MALAPAAVKKIVNNFEDYGVFEGLTSIAFSHPFDTIKVRLQTVGQIDFGQGKHLYCGPMDCFIKILRREGVLSFYKGMSLPLVTAIPVNFLTFYAYNALASKQTIDGSKLNRSQVLIDGALAGGLPAVLVSPTERIKCMLQIPTGYYSNIRTPFNVAGHIYKTEGIKGFFRGTLLTTVRDSLSTAILFISYYWLKFNYLKNNPQFMDLKDNVRNQRLKYIGAGFIGGLSGVLSTLPTIPIDFVKTRFQFRTDSMNNLIKEMQLEAERQHSSILRISFTGTPLILFRAFLQYSFTFSILQIYKNVQYTQLIKEQRGDDVDDATLRKDLEALEEIEANGYKI